MSEFELNLKENEGNSAIKSRTSLIKIESWLNKIFSFFVITLLIALSLTVLLQVFARVFLPESPVWTEELSRYIFVYLIAFGIGVAFQEGELVSVELFQHNLSERGKIISRTLIDVTLLSFSLFMVSHSLDFVSIGQFQTSPTLFVKMNFIYFSTTLIFTNLSLFIFIDLIKNIMKFIKKEV